MKKQLIVVVHGVGVRNAGVSSDLVAAALQGDPDARSADHIRPHSTDDFLLMERSDYGDNDKRTTFPARLRRYRNYDDKGAITRERVIADFYWGDITAFRSGVSGAILAFFKVAMGLSHAIRENAAEVYGRPEDKGRKRTDAALAWLATASVMIIHGPIVAINMVLLLGLFTAWIASALIPAEMVAAVTSLLVGAVAIGGGIVGLKKSYAFLARHLFEWVAFSGVIMLLAWSVPAWLGPGGVVGWFDDFLREASCNLLDGTKKENCIDDYRGVYLVGLRLLGLMVLLWIAVFACVIAFLVVSLFRPARSGDRNGGAKVVNLVAAAIGLMTMLWLLLISAVWTAIGRSGLKIIPNADHVSSALRGVVPAAIALLLLGLAALAVLRRKRSLRTLSGSDLTSAYFGQAKATVDGFRLLINPYMLTILVVFVVLAVWITVHSLPWVCRAGGDLFGLGAACRATTWVLGNTTEYLLAGLAVVGVALVQSLRAEFAAGLGIVADVLAYLNNYSWRSKASDPNIVRRTWLERRSFWDRQLPDDKPRGYWLRRRIQDRLRVLMNHLIRDEAPEQIVLVSHSQGTVIALDVIASDGAVWREAENGKTREIKLVTMGSPYTHLYNYYFPTSFESVATRASLARLDPTNPDAKGVLSEWTNIFRVDDFVGTYVSDFAGATTRWPEEHAVRANGHTMYWVDQDVFATIARKLKF